MRSWLLGPYLPLMHFLMPNTIHTQFVSSLWNWVYEKTLLNHSFNHNFLSFYKTKYIQWNRKNCWPIPIYTFTLLDKSLSHMKTFTGTGTQNKWFLIPVQLENMWLEQISSKRGNISLYHISLRRQLFYLMLFTHKRINTHPSFHAKLEWG